MRGTLCSHCRGIFTGYRSDRTIPCPHHPSFNTLCDAADVGCFICTQVKHMLLSNIEWRNRKFRSTSYCFEDFGVPGLLTIYVEWEEGVIDDCLTFRMTALIHDPLEISPTWHQALSSEGTTELMQVWLSNCLSWHDECSRRIGNTIKSRLPTRLLNVGDPGAQFCRLRLTSSDSLEHISEGYLTLSHRWNESNFLKLNSSNMDRMLEGFPISTLPQCFRDAVFLAHKFRIRYLWIDSLCIKQDSEEDWGREVPRMKDVYGGAVINIVAGHSTGPEDSMFHTKDRLFAQSAIVRSEWDDKTPMDDIVWNHTNIKQDFERAPLTQRGWVFQELMLAPRTLQFGKTQVYWRCSKLFACESLPHGASPPIGRGITYGTDLNELRLASFTGSKPDHSPIYIAWLWEDILKQYSSCELTFSKDKLVALSGVARAFQQFTGDRYCFGLWWSSMIWSLSWRRDNRVRKSAKIRPEYCAPTWSWASIDEPTDFRYHGPDPNDRFWTQELADVVDAHPNLPVDEDRAGQVKDAYVRIRGRLHSFVILSDGDEGVHCNIDGETRAGDDQFTADIALQNPEKMELWILPTLLRTLSPQDEWRLSLNGDFVLEGLVLMKSEDVAGTSRDGGTYKRVGHFQSRNYAVGMEDKAFGMGFEDGPGGALEAWLGYGSGHEPEDEPEDKMSDEESFQGGGSGEGDAKEEDAKEEDAKEEDFSEYDLDDGRVDEEGPYRNGYENSPMNRYLKLRRQPGAWTEIKIV